MIEFDVSGRDGASLRRAGKELLSLALIDARNQTFAEYQVAPRRDHWRLVDEHAHAVASYRATDVVGGYHALKAEGIC